MLLPVFGLLLASLARIISAVSDLEARDTGSTDRYVLHLDRNASPTKIAARLGLRYEGLLGELADHHVFSGAKIDDDIVQGELHAHQQKRSLGDRDVLDGVLLSIKQEPRERLQKRAVPLKVLLSRVAGLERAIAPRISSSQENTTSSDAIAKLNITDPGFGKQWHLFNTEQTGNDLNVLSVWLEGITGKNATVAIVDDGLDMYSNDLKANYYATGSYDFNDEDNEPRPVFSDDSHGTRCAGEVAAGKNDVCGVGVAYDARIAGIRILSGSISDADEAAALNYDYQNNQIYSCSWGPPDDGKTMMGPSLLTKRAFLNGVQNGRGSLGSIFVLATGNGGLYQDDCNFDGYANSIYTLTIGAIDRYNKSPYYSETCAAQLAVTYSSGSGDSIYTTDVGVKSCTSSHGGTSAAAPLAAGVFALALEIRPDLSWRDMQYLTLQSAVPVDTNLTSLQTTAIGKTFSHITGYGKIDASKLIAEAKTWKNVKPQSWYFSPWIQVQKQIPKGEGGTVSTFEVTADMLTAANLETVEHVTVVVTATHGHRGDLSMDLTSPEKVTSHIARVREKDAGTYGWSDWEFMSVAHWGEKGVGTWSVVIRDTVQDNFNGTFVEWRLKLWGVSIDAAKATKLPMPTSSTGRDDDVATGSGSTGSGSTGSGSTGSGSKSGATMSRPPAIFGLKMLNSQVTIIISILVSCTLWSILA